MEHLAEVGDTLKKGQAGNAYLGLPADRSQVRGVAAAVSPGR